MHCMAQLSLRTWIFNRLFHPSCSGNWWILFLQEQISTVISSPLEVYKRFVSMTLRPLSLTVTKTSPGPYQVLEICGDKYFDCFFAPKVAKMCPSLFWKNFVIKEPIKFLLAAKIAALESTIWLWQLEDTSPFHLNFLEMLDIRYWERSKLLLFNVYIIQWLCLTGAD